MMIAYAVVEKLGRQHWCIETPDELTNENSDLIEAIRPIFIV